jgi:hypothetical protein
LGNRRPPVLQYVENELIKSLIRLATEDIDLVTEIRDCMLRIPWSSIEAIDESESSWFQPGPGRVENEGHAPQAGPSEDRMILDSQPTSDDVGLNSGDRGDESQTPKPSDDGEMKTPTQGGDEEEMDNDEQDSNDKQKAPPSGVTLQDAEDQVMDDDRQDSNDREKAPPSGVVSQDGDEEMDNDRSDSNDKQKAPPSGVTLQDGEDQEMDDSNDREKTPPSGVLSQDQEMGDDVRSRGANDAPLGESPQKLTPQKRLSSNIDNNKAQPEDPRLRLRKRKDDAPPLNPEPPAKKRKVIKPKKRQEVDHLTAGSSIQAAIDVDKLFVSIIAPPSVTLSLIQNTGRARCHP